MRVAVDLNRCQGYAQCAFLAPDVFTIRGQESLLYTPYADDSQRERVSRAVVACPVRAIEVDWDGDAGWDDEVGCGGGGDCGGEGDCADGADRDGRTPVTEVPGAC